MKLTTSGAALAAGTLGLCASASADFQAALNEYHGGHYEVAHAQFLALAELGDCSSQFNLGAMALQGQGGAKDLGSGVGWLQAAAGNGCQTLVGNKLGDLQAKLSGDEMRTAASIVARYGHDALHQVGVVSPDYSCPGVTRASVLVAAAPEYPRLAHGGPETAVVVTEMTIGVDGRARDPQILLAVPEEGFAAAAIEAWLNSSFTPAMRGEAPVESHLQAKLVFSRHGVQRLAQTDTYKSARTRADAGDPAAQYLYGVTAIVDSTLGISFDRAGEMLLDSARDGDARAQFWVGSQLRATSSCHPKASGEIWLRHAAERGSAAAQLTLAHDLLASNPSPAQASEAHALLERAAGSDDFYVMKHVVAMLSSAPQEAVRDAATARTVANKLRLGPIQSDPQMFEVIAAAYAASGDFGAAAHEQQTAIRKAQTLKWDTRAMQQRMVAYKEQQPWHGDLLASNAR